MSVRRTVILGASVWLAVISSLHGWLNLGLFDRSTSSAPRGVARFRVGFLPVT
jgi:hypothetical protein